MLENTPLAAASGAEPLLYVAELLHRVSNEYASAISLASVAASGSSSPEVRTALEPVIELLAQLVKAHRVLSPPTVESAADLGGYLTQLCQAKAEAELERRGTTLRLAVVSPVALDNVRCWRVGLIVSELITNAARHGLPSGPGEICVLLAADAGQVVCRVSDNGSAAATITPGLGTRIVDALAAELDGRVERRFGETGATITLTFPAQSCRSAHWPENSPRLAVGRHVGGIPRNCQPSAQSATLAGRHRMRTATRPRG